MSAETQFLATNVQATATDNSSIVYIPAWVFLFVCPAIVALRLWASHKASGMGREDWLIFAAMIAAVVTYIVSIWGCYQGVGKHTPKVSEESRQNALIAVFVLQTTYKISINLTKASIALVYLRLFGTVTWCKRTCWALFTVIILYIVAITGVSIGECRPVAAVFDRTIVDKRCINNAVFRYVMGGFSIMTDLVLIAIPIPLVWPLRISCQKKVLVICGFGLGIFVVIASVLRITTIDVQVKSHDPLYDVSAIMWTLIEMGVAIVVACVPQIRLFIVRGVSRLIPRLHCAEDMLTPLGTTGHEKTNQKKVGPASGGTDDDWTIISRPDRVRLSNVIIGNASPRIVPRPDDMSPEMGIRRTIDYGFQVENRKDSPV